MYSYIGCLQVSSLAWSIGLDKQIVQRKDVNIFLPISFNKCFWYSNEPSYGDGSFEYPQHMFWLRNKKLNFRYALLTKVLMIIHMWARWAQDWDETEGGYISFVRKNGIIVLAISLNMCFECSKEPYHRDSSFEYPQHMFWLRNKKI